LSLQEDTSLSQDNSTSSGTGRPAGDVLKNIDSTESLIPLSEGDGLLVEKNGHLELEQEVKEKILKAFKEEAPPPENPEEACSPPGDEGDVPHTPRIFSSLEEEGALEKIAAVAAVKALEEERKAKAEPPAEDSPPGPQEMPPRVLAKLKSEKPGMVNGEVVMLSPRGAAVALEYKPGMIPRVVAAASRQKALPLLREAIRLEIPVVQVDGWEREKLGELKAGMEIPAEMYSAAATALAATYKVRPEARLVKLITLGGREKTPRRDRSRKLVRKYGGLLKVPPLSVEVSEDLYRDRDFLKQQLEVVTVSVVSHLGLIVPTPEIEKSDIPGEGQFFLKLRGISHDMGSLDLEMEPPELFYPLQNRFRHLLNTYGFELLGYAETEALLESVKKKSPGLVKSLFPHHFTIGGLRFVLRGLLREQVPIKDLVGILEAIDSRIPDTVDPEMLIEYVRARFATQISNNFKDSGGSINALILHPGTEQKIMGSIKESNNVRWLDMEYSLGLQFLTNLIAELEAAVNLGINPVILTSPVLRRFVRKITETSLPRIPVLSYNEIAPMTQVKAVGIINLE
jgi:type III secretion system FlhB-like substrate exporter